MIFRERKCKLILAVLLGHGWKMEQDGWVYRAPNGRTVKFIDIDFMNESRLKRALKAGGTPVSDKVWPWLEEMRVWAR